ncbi:MAG: hypothetical protein MJZ18_03700 [Bacteroidales bacterium]|nr:hypothetical protein [Bacteroidales bacterium]
MIVKKGYIRPLLLEIGLDETSVLLTLSDGKPPIYEGEGGGDNENGDEGYEGLLSGGLGDRTKIWNRNVPF